MEPYRWQMWLKLSTGNACVLPGMGGWSNLRVNRPPMPILGLLTPTAPVNQYIYIYIYIYNIYIYQHKIHDNTTVYIAVECPANSGGESIPSGCTANPGYSGTVTPTQISPWYTSDITGKFYACVLWVSSQNFCAGKPIYTYQHKIHHNTIVQLWTVLPTMCVHSCGMSCQLRWRRCANWLWVQCWIQWICDSFHRRAFL